MSRLTQQHALRVFAEHVAQHPEFDASALDELCRSHSELEGWLRRMARERDEARVEVPHVASPDVKKLGVNTPRRTRGTPERYVLLGEVARGGMGVILRVWDVVLERPLAMKVLDPGKAAKKTSALEDARARFLTEARIAGRLHHPGVVPIHDLGVDENDRLYFTMPYFEGRTLEQAFELVRTRTDGWSLGRALQALAKVCEIIAFAHAHEVIHRDLKPANVIVGEFGAVYVVDWGLAKVLGQSEPVAEPAKVADKADDGEARDGQTLNGTVAGTPPYMAPEQADGRVADVSYRADVYAVGAMLYRLIAGRAPYVPRQEREEPESAEQMVELIRRGPPTPVRRLVPDAPEELVAVCERAMARDPMHRYASVEDLARDLHAYIESHADEEPVDRVRSPAREPKGLS